MPSVRSISVLVLALCSGCAAQGGQALRVRVLNTEAPRALLPEPSAADFVDQQPERAAPRLGAPGGSGAGSRRVMPARPSNDAQSGNDTVGGLPAGMGGVTGPLG